MELYERIRRHNRDEGLGIRALAARHHVHRRNVREALASATPPGREAPEREAPALGPWTMLIRAWLVADRDAPRMAAPHRRRVHQRLVAEYGANLAESTVRAYVARTTTTRRHEELTTRRSSPFPASQESAAFVAPFCEDFPAAAAAAVDRSLAACSPRALTLRWSIASPPTGPPPAGTPGRAPRVHHGGRCRAGLTGAAASGVPHFVAARLAGLRPQPRVAAPRRPRQADCAGRRRQPGRRAHRRRVAAPPGVEPILLTGVGHFLMLEDPEQFNAVLVETLASFERRAAGPVGGSTTARRAASRDQRRRRAPRHREMARGVEVLDLEPRMGVGVAAPRIEEPHLGMSGCSYQFTSRTAGPRFDRQDEMGLTRKAESRTGRRR